MHMKKLLFLAATKRMVVLALTIFLSFQLNAQTVEQPPATDINVEIPNNYTQKQLRKIEKEFAAKGMMLTCNRVKWNDEGRIVSMHVKFVSSKGTVQGHYKGFASIKVFSSKESGVGISPVQLNTVKL